MNDSLNIGFIGLGLIGGSTAKAIRKYFKNFTITAYARRKETLDQAFSEKVIDYGTTSIDNSFSDCDYIFLCTPVEYNIEFLEKLKPIIKPSCIITDVGSVKTNIHEAVITLDMEKNFIGGHPMAGSERSGFEFSTDYLLENAFYVLTPTASSPKESLVELEEMVKTFGAIPVVLDYNEHDYTVAAISHLPHLIASGLVNTVKELDSDKQIMKLLAAGGFKDITRIASSSPVMWQQICHSNSNNICRILTDYINLMCQVRDKIADNTDQYIYDFFDTSREYRNSFSNTPSGPIAKVYALYCDIIDEAGAIATIATILAAKNISIKNIGIIHNREFEEGVLKIEFYDDESVNKAVNLLTKHKYTIYKR